MNRVLFHVNHLWGVGHFTRTAAIANAVVAQGDEATLIAGNTPVFARLDPRVRLVALPAVRSPNTSYTHLVDMAGDPVTPAHWDERWERIAATLAEARPQVLVTETFPFGRRKLAGELLQLIAAAKPQATVVSSVRDIPFIPSGGKRIAECADRLRAHYDAVLIHGDERVFPLADFWPGELPTAVHHTGFIAELPGALTPDVARRGVIVSAGGGGDAAPLLRAAMAARRSGLLAGEPWLFVTGPHAPAGLLDDLTATAPLNTVTVLRSADDLPARIASARLSISRGGSTVAETVAAGTRAVVVPFSADGQPEQAIRAERFAAQHLLVALPESRLSPKTLSEATVAALAAPPPAPDAIRLGGARCSAALLAQLAKHG